MAMGDDLEPGESEAGIFIGIEVFEQIGHVKLDLPLSLLIEAVGGVEDSQDVDQHAVVRLLVEVVRKLTVVRVELLLHELEDFRHELLLVEFEGFQEDNHEFHKRIYVPVV